MTNESASRLIEREGHNVAARLCYALTAACCIVATPATAQSYPNQPIKLIIPFTPGGGTDITARLVAEYLAPRLGATIVPENRPGASAALGAGIVAKSPPNGYTCLSVRQHLRAMLPFLARRLDSIS